MRRALAAAACGAALLGAAACGASDEPGTGEDPSDAATTAQSPTEEATPEVFETPDGVTFTAIEAAGPVGVAAVGRDAWAALPEADAVAGPDGTTVRVGTLPLRLVDTPAGLWVSTIGNSRVVRVDTSTGEVDLRTAVAPPGSEPEGLAYDGRQVWVVDQAGDRVLPLDPVTGALGDPVGVGHEPRLVAAGPDAVYVTNYSEGSLTRVADGRAETRNAAGCLTPQGVAVADGVVWVACTVDGKVVGYDADTLAPVARLPGLDGADAVVADGRRVYVVGQSGPTVWTIDTADRSLAGELVLGENGPTTENVDGAVVGKTLVVSHPEAGGLFEVPLSLLPR